MSDAASPRGCGSTEIAALLDRRIRQDIGIVRCAVVINHANCCIFVDASVWIDPDHVAGLDELG